MPSSSQIKDIRFLLSTANSFLLNPKKQRPHNYISLKNDILLKELEYEVDFLEQALRFPDSFMEQFTARCHKRAVDKHERALNYSIHPESFINELNWDIAQILFPENASAILFPCIKNVLSAELPEQFPIFLSARKMKAFWENNIQINSAEASVLNTIDFAELKYYVFTEKLAFDVRCMENFSLNMHRQLYHQLNMHYPELARVLYTHNMTLKILEADILFILYF